MAPLRKPWLDHLRKAFGARDEAEREAELSKMEAALPSGDGSAEGATSEGDDANHHHVTVNIGGIEAKPNNDADDGEEGEPEDGTAMDEEKVKALITEAVGPMATALEAITAKIEAMSTANAEVKEQVEAIGEAMEDMSDPEDISTQDAVARAEILAPGLKRPTTDAKPGSKSHRDAMAGFQRAALKQALTTDQGRAVVGAVLGHVQPHRIATMPANEVAVAFRGASQLMLDHNAASTVSTFTSAISGFVRDEQGKPVRPMTPADLQANANAYYKRSAV